jgi:hypothetical protein
MLKRFSEWFGLKTKLHERHQTPPLVSEREIWWASVGENVGSEINGKSAPFSRTVIIYKKLSHGFYFVIPTTTQKKRGVGSFDRGPASSSRDRSWSFVAAARPTYQQYDMVLGRRQRKETCGERI